MLYNYEYWYIITKKNCMCVKDVIASIYDGSIIVQTKMSLQMFRNPKVIFIYWLCPNCQCAKIAMLCRVKCNSNRKQPQCRFLNGGEQNKNPVFICDVADNGQSWYDIEAWIQRLFFRRVMDIVFHPFMLGCLRKWDKWSYFYVLYIRLCATLSRVFSWRKKRTKIKKYERWAQK